MWNIEKHTIAVVNENRRVSSNLFDEIGDNVLQD